MFYVRVPLQIMYTKCFYPGDAWTGIIESYSLLIDSSHVICKMYYALLSRVELCCFDRCKGCNRRLSQKPVIEIICEKLCFSLM